MPPCSMVAYGVSCSDLCIGRGCIRWKIEGVSYQTYPYCRRISFAVRFCDVTSRGEGRVLVYLLPERDNFLSCCWDLVESTSFDDIYINWQKTKGCVEFCTWKVYASLARRVRLNQAWLMRHLYHVLLS